MKKTTQTKQAASIDWASRFSSLGDAFYTPWKPTPVPSPVLAIANQALAKNLLLDVDWLRSDDALAVFSGNRIPSGAEPLASVYSGHQFGVWAGQLGDGRAILLGEIAGQEVQLKGAGRTPYSRQGDGRAVLRSSIREYLASIVFRGLGIPSTEALCLVASPLPVHRESVESAAIITRVAPSFIRFGHFEHFAAAGDEHALRRLADHVIEHHLPDCLSAAVDEANGNPYAVLLREVSLRTARLIAHWQAQGFCHGVMNSDNMSILGLTLDYGPFQFFDVYDPAHICNHSDHRGRYAFNQQPQIAYWNLHCLAHALLPLLDSEAQARQMLAVYPEQLATHFIALMRQKLGLRTAEKDDAEWIESLLALLQKEKVDYPLFWWHLTEAVAAQGGHSADFARVRALFANAEAFDAWLPTYLGRLSARSSVTSQQESAALMRRINPHYVLRNYVAELVVQEAQRGNFHALTTIALLLETPFDQHPDHENWASAPPDWASRITVSCSS